MKSRCLTMRRLSLAAAFPLVILGCATPATAPVPVVASVAFKEGQTLWQPASALTTASESVPRAWWKMYRDPVLDELQEQLSLGNEGLKIAAAQLEAARAAVRASEASLGPSLSVGAAATRSASPAAATGGRTTANSVSLTASAAWEPDLWGRVAAGVSVADARMQASKNDLAGARLSVQAALVQTYLALRAAEAQQDVLRRSAASYQRSLELTQARHAGGVVALGDVLQAQTQLRTVQAQLHEANAQRAQLEHAIAVLLGRPPSEFSLVVTARLPDPPTVPALLPSTLLARRPDIASAERSVAAAYAQMGVANAAFFPSLSLSASAGFRSQALGGLTSAPNLLWSLGPSLSAAVFDGGARRAASDQARAQADSATASYRQTVLTAFQEVEDNLVLLDQLTQELRLQNEALVAARRSLEITQDQYRAGTVSFLNVAVAQIALLSTEAGMLSVRNRQLAAINLLLKNVGGSWQEG